MFWRYFSLAAPFKSLNCLRYDVVFSSGDEDDKVRE